MKRKRYLFFGGIFLVFCLIGFYIYKQKQAEEEKQASIRAFYESFEVYSKDLSIADYQLINNGNGIVIEWKVTNQEEVNMSSNKAKRHMTWARYNSDYIVSNNVRLHNVTMDGPLGKDEYVKLDVFKIGESDIVEEEVDLGKLLEEYLGEAPYKIFVGSSNSIVSINGVSYYTVEVQKNKSDKDTIFIKLNLETKKIDGTISEAELTKETYHLFEILDHSNEYSSNRFDTMLLGSGNGAYFIRIDEKTNLSKSNQDAYKLFMKDNSEAYALPKYENGVLVNGSEILSLWTEFLPLGRSIYDVATLPAEASNDGKEHRITKYQDIVTYGATSGEKE